MRRITKVVLLSRMTSYSIIIFMALALRSLSISAQSSSDIENKLAVMSSAVHALDSSEQMLLSRPLPATSEKVSVASFTVHRQKSSLLLHLRQAHNKVELQVINSMGDVVQTTSPDDISSGFYELPVLSQPHEPGLYVVKLVVNERVIMFRTRR